MRLEDLPATLSIPEAAEILGVGRDLAYQAASHGELPTVRVGRRVLVRTDKLLELLGAQPGVCTHSRRRGHSLPAPSRDRLVQRRVLRGPS